MSSLKLKNKFIELAANQLYHLLNFSYMWPKAKFCYLKLRMLIKILFEKEMNNFKWFQNYIVFACANRINRFRLIFISSSQFEYLAYICEFLFNYQIISKSIYERHLFKMREISFAF